MGKFFSTNNIKIEKVLSSPVCRCWETAKYAGWKYKIDKRLTSNIKNKSKKITGTSSQEGMTNRAGFLGENTFSTISNKSCAKLVYNMYIDWNGNSVGYNLPRFRKPGHGGDLIRKGKRRYIHFPSIEKRYDAWIEPDEEYATGGEYNLGDEVELTEAEVKRLRSLGYTIEQI